jgi:hypothetical protein
MIYDLLLIEVSPCVREEHKDHKNTPTRECTETTRKASLIQEETDSK